MWEKYIVYVLTGLCPIGLLNFFVFMFVSFYLGGSALNGKIVSGHYHLGSHGHYTEVSFGVFLYSKIHGLITIGMFVMVIGLGFLLEFKGKKDFPPSIGPSGK